MHVVIRDLPVNYIYFDLFFLAIYLYFLSVYKKILPLLAFLVGGVLIFCIDYGYWMHVNGVRTLEIAPSFFPNCSEGTRKFLFMAWFSQTYGIMFSWVFIMFEKRSNKLYWTFLLYFWWIAAGLLAQLVNSSGEFFRPCRVMNDIRVFQVGGALLGYVVLGAMGYRPLKLLYLFLTGCSIHFMMESSLFITKVRPWNEDAFSLLIYNSIVEFNQGIPILFIAYDNFLKKIFREKRV